MEQLILRAERRTVVGKKVKRLRRDGQVPGIVYGPVVPETIPVSVDRREFEKFYQATGHSTMFTLAWDGQQQPVFIREVQQDPVKRLPLHIDFFAPNLAKEIEATVPLVFHHAHSSADSVLTHVRTELDVRGLPSAIPTQIDVDLSSLAHAGDAFRVADLVLPPGLTALVDGEAPLAHLEHARVSAEEAAPEPEEATVPVAPAAPTAPTEE